MEKIIGIEEVEEVEENETVDFQVLGTTRLGFDYGYKYHYNNSGKLVGIETIVPNSLGGVETNW